MNQLGNTQHLAAAVLVISLAAGVCAAAEDWPVVRGNKLGTGIATSSLPESLDTLWTYRSKNDAGFDATAVIADGVAYVGDSAGTIHAVKLSDGTAVWTKEFPESSFAAGAAIDGDRLFVGDLEGTVRCLATSDGDELWSASLDAEIFAGPIPHGDDVLFTSESGALVCFNASTGKERWPAFRIDSPLRCSPTISEGRVMLAGCDSLLHVIDVNNGKELHTVQIDGPTGSTPAIFNERVYFGTEGGSFYAIDLPAEGQPAVAWTYRDPRRGQPIRSAAAVNGRVVVYGSQGKAVYALDPRTGELKWQVPMRSRVESSPVIAGGRALLATTGGKLYLLNLATGETTWEFDAGGGFVASPAVVDGRVVIGNTGGTLYCFGSDTAAARQAAAEQAEGNDEG